MKHFARIVLRENGLPRPAKGGSTPAFACQRAAIAPLPCLNLQTCFSLISQLRICRFSKKRLQQKKQIAEFNLLRKCGLLAHTSPTFLKKLLDQKTFYFACGLELKTMLLGKPPTSGSARLGHIPSLPWES